MFVVVLGIEFEIAVGNMEVKIVVFVGFVLDTEVDIKVPVLELYVVFKEVLSDELVVELTLETVFVLTVLLVKVVDPACNVV